MKIKVMNKLGFEALLRFIEKEDKDTSKIFFISIMDPEIKEPLKPDMDNYMTTWFYDVEETTGNITAVTEEQLREIYEFVKKNREKEYLFVHCSAGVSRSGAVGTFVNDFMEQDHKKFKQVNPQVMPNGRVLRTLHRMHREDESENK